jgi:hypothetical protein
MNACSREPLVVGSGRKPSRWGRGTVTGRSALKLYRGLETQSIKACAGTWGELRKLLKD